MTDWISTSQMDFVTTLTLNRPEARNALAGGDAVDELVAKLLAADAATDSRVVIITGAGSAFCAGGDLRSLQVDSGGPVHAASAHTRANYKAGIQRIPLAFEQLEKPVIAAVNGAAIGAGFDIACMCDIRIAADTALFSSSFVKLGLVSGDGGAWYLPRLVGWSRAAEIIFTGRRVSAAEALALGLVSQVVSRGELDEAAHALAREIAANAPQAVRMSKVLMRESRLGSLTTVLELAASFQAHAHQTEEHLEALAALLKSTPK